MIYTIVLLEFRNVWDQSWKEEGLIRMVIILQHRFLTMKTPSLD